LDFIGTAGADAEFCASPGAVTTPNSVAAIVTAKMIRLFMRSAPSRADEVRA
jgi:hypothetical protein